MRKSIAILALVVFVALGLLYMGAMTLAHAAVHVSKTVKTSHGIHHTSVTHTKHGTMIHTGSMAY
jgi:hypothetical protein